MRASHTRLQVYVNTHKATGVTNIDFTCMCSQYRSSFLFTVKVSLSFLHHSQWLT